MSPEPLCSGQYSLCFLYHLAIQKVFWLIPRNTPLQEECLGNPRIGYSLLIPKQLDASFD